MVRPVGWGLTQEMTEKYLLTGGEDPGWKPGLDYYHRLVARMVAALDPTSNVFPRMDWRFKEFPNEGTHCLYVTCVELMTLPDKPSLVGEQLIDVILEGHSHIPPDKLPDWINSLGLILSNLPESYWVGLHSKIEAALLSPELANFSWSCEPGQLLDFTEIHNMQTSPGLAHLLAVVHSTWHHSGFNQLCAILDLLRDKLVKMVQTEEQMLFIFHMVRRGKDWKSFLRRSSCSGWTVPAKAAHGQVHEDPLRGDGPAVRDPAEGGQERGAAAAPGRGV